LKFLEKSLKDEKVLKEFKTFESLKKEFEKKIKRRKLLPKPLPLFSPSLLSNLARGPALPSAQNGSRRPTSLSPSFLFFFWPNRPASAQLFLPSPQPGQPHQAAALLRSTRFLSAAQLSTSSLSSPTANPTPLVSTIPFLQPSPASHQAVAAGRIPAPFSLPLLQAGHKGS
jgi:hypothetical protein